MSTSSEPLLNDLEFIKAVLGTLIMQLGGTVVITQAEFDELIGYRLLEGYTDAGHLALRVHREKAKH